MMLQTERDRTEAPPDWLEGWPPASPADLRQWLVLRMPSIHREMLALEHEIMQRISSRSVPPTARWSFIGATRSRPGDPTFRAVARMENVPRIARNYRRLRRCWRQYAAARDALAPLPRRIIVLRYQRGMRSAAISERTGIEPWSVRRLHDAAIVSMWQFLTGSEWVETGS